MKVTDEMVTDAMNTYLHISPDGVNTAGLRAVLEQVLTPAQPAPVVGGSDWYAEQHARDSKELRKLCESRDFYKRRCDSLQALQPNMRDPERKAVCDILANGTTTVLSICPAESVAQGGESWRCFHCDEVFTDREAAALHFGNFGPRSYTDAHCLIDAPKLRDMEFQLHRYQEEDGPIHRLMHRQAGEHTQALIRAEEAGYAKALKDTNYSEPPTPATGSGGDSFLLDSGKIAIAGRDEFGEKMTTLHSGVNLRAAIQAAIDYDSPAPAGGGAD